MSLNNLKFRIWLRCKRHNILIFFTFDILSFWSLMLIIFKLRRSQNNLGRLNFLQYSRMMICYLLFRYFCWYRHLSWQNANFTISNTQIFHRQSIDFNIFLWDAYLLKLWSDSIFIQLIKLVFLLHLQQLLLPSLDNVLETGGVNQFPS